MHIYIIRYKMISEIYIVQDNSGDYVDYSTGQQYRPDNTVKPLIYQNMISNAINNEPFCIGERVTPVGSLRLPLELRFANQGTQEAEFYYDYHFINCILALVHRAVAEVYIPPEQRDNPLYYATIVTESDEPYVVKSSLCFRIDIVMPAIRVDQASVHNTLKPFIDNLFRESNIQHHLDHPLERDLDSSWVKPADFQLFYGATKHLDDAPMTIMSVYQCMSHYPVHQPVVKGQDCDMSVSGEILRHQCWNIDTRMRDVLNGLTVDDFIDDVLCIEDDEDYIVNSDQVYAALLSSQLYNVGYSLSVLSRAPPSNMVEVSIIDDDGLRNCETLIRLLPKNFFQSLPNILGMAKSVYSVDSGADGYNLFARNLESMRPHINPGNDEQFAKMLLEPSLIWSRCEMENTDRPETLLWYVKQYNDGGYQRWRNQLLEPMLKECRTGTHTDKTMVTIIKTLFFDCLRVTYVGNRPKLFYYHDHHWQGNCAEKYIYDTITHHLVKWFRDQRIALETQAASPQPIQNNLLGAPPAMRGRARARPVQRPVDDTSSQIECLNQIITLLGSGKYFSIIKNMSMYELVDERFEKHLDSSKLVHAIRNGVIEIIGNRIYFRQGRPNDYISKTMSWTFRTDYSPTHPDVVRAMKWLRSVYVEPDFYRQPQNQHWLRDEQTFLSLENIPPLLDYVLRVKASCFRAGNREKRVYCQTGRSGNNSKSTITFADGLVFGSYFSKVHMELLTKDWRSGANPEAIQMTSSLMAVADEPNEGVMLNGNVIKVITGNDQLAIRDMYVSGTGKVTNNTKVFINCNVPPPVKGGGVAMKRRMVMTPHNAIYSENCPYVNYLDQYMNTTFPMDNFFDDSISSYVNAIGWIYFNWYHRYAARPSEQPEAVKALTAKFWADNDQYRMFVRHRMVGEAPQNNMVDNSRYSTCPDLYTKFKTWFMTMFPKQDIPTYVIFVEEMNAILGQAREERWYGWTYSAPGNAGGMNFQL